jgi:outer membrane protein assembly factor BamB
MGAFVDGGQLDRPWYLTFGPDGNLYVSSSATNQVLCYDGTSGAFIRVAAQDFFLGAPDGISFAADGTMLVSKFPALDSRVMRFNPQTGAFIENVVDEPGLSGALEHRLSADGSRIFVSSFNSNQVREYDVATGAFIRNFIAGAPLAGPVGQLVMPDGSLLVSSWNNDSIFRYDAVTGALLGTFAQGGALNNPNNMAILNIPEPAGMIVWVLAIACLLARCRSM